MKPNQKNEVVEAAKVEAAEPPSTLPSGVFHHDAGSPPILPPNMVEAPKDPKQPPPGWVGSWKSCGSCGAFLGVAKNCPACFPGAVPENVHNLGVMKC